MRILSVKMIKLQYFLRDHPWVDLENSDIIFNYGLEMKSVMSSAHRGAIHKFFYENGRYRRIC